MQVKNPTQENSCKSLKLIAPGLKNPEPRTHLFVFSSGTQCYWERVKTQSSGLMFTFSLLRGPIVLPPPWGLSFPFWGLGLGLDERIRGHAPES